MSGIPKYLALLALTLASRLVAAPYLPSEEWYLPTADKAAELYIYEVGRGAPIVVVHGGFGAEHSYLLDSVRGLEGKFRFIFYDQRGSLRSPAKAETISIDQHVQDIETLRKSLGLERISIMAHSMGTHLALRYLKQYPSRVAGLVLTGALPMQSGKFLDPAVLPALNAAGARARSFLDRPEKAAELAKLGCAPPACSARDATRAWRISFASGNVFNIERWRAVKGGRAFYSPVAAQAAANGYSNDYDFAEAVDAHPFPITVINGDHDFADFDAVWFSSFAKNRPCLKLVTLKQAGHNAWIDQPAAFRAALNRGMTASEPCKRTAASPH
jgi:pimeloyl-ACP methyl ester carboxylesterase